MTPIPPALETWMSAQEDDYAKRWANKFPSDLEHDLWLMRDSMRKAILKLAPLISAARQSCWCGSLQPGLVCHTCEALDALGLLNG